MRQKEKDKFLFESLLNNHKEGILEIYRSIFPQVQAYILKSGGTVDDAKDVMQKSLLQISIRMKTGDFKINSSFSGYLFTVCKNFWKHSQKTAETRVTYDKIMPLIHEEREIALSALEQDKWELFQEMLLKLSENCKQILGHYFNKVSYGKIAEMFDYASESTVRQRVFKCKSKLKSLIQQDVRYKEIKEL